MPAVAVVALPPLSVTALRWGDTDLFVSVSEPRGVDLCFSPNRDNDAGTPAHEDPMPPADRPIR